MSEIIELKKRHAGGRPSPYDESVHIPLVYEIFEEAGKGIAAFCAKAGICEDTFYEWQKKHPRFKKAYKIALKGGQAMWEELPKQLMLMAAQAGKGLAFNFSYWRTIMDRRYGYFKVRLPKVEDQTPTGRMKAFWEGLEAGIFTTQQMRDMSTGILAEMKIKEIEHLKSLGDTSIQEEVAEATDAALQAFMAVKTGKAKVIEVKE